MVPGCSFGQTGEHFGARLHLGIWGEILAPGRLFGHAGGHFGSCSAILVTRGAHFWTRLRFKN